MKVVFVLFFALLFLNASFAASAQDAVQEKNSKNRRGSINVPVVVSDREGRRISGLKKENFTLYQGGVKRTITSFATDEEPITVALLLDTSGSTQNVLDKIKEAAEEFIESLKPGDRCLIATFDSKINILASFSPDKIGLKKSLDKLQTAEREGSILFSAVNQISQISFNNVQGRKAIVLLSDGNDLGSSVSRRELMANLEETDISIYPIFFKSGVGFNKPVVSASGVLSEGKEEKKPKKPLPKPKKKKKVYSVLIPLPTNSMDADDVKLIDKVSTIGAVNALRELSDLTAGRFYIGDNEKLGTIFRQVAGELREQYLIGFDWEGAAIDGFVRDISVKVDRPNVIVQALTKLRSKGF